MKVFIKKKIDKNDYLNALKIFNKDDLDKKVKLELWNSSKSNQFISSYNLYFSAQRGGR